MNPETLTEALDLAIQAHPPIDTPTMNPVPGTPIAVHVSDDAIDRAQIAALGGYPADLCGVWERSKS